MDFERRQAKADVSHEQKGNSIEWQTELLGPAIKKSISLAEHLASAPFAGQEGDAQKH